MVLKNMFLLGFWFFSKRRYWVQDVSTQAWHESDECRSSRCSHDLWQVSLVRGRPSNNHKQCLQSWNWGNYTSISTNVSKYQGFRGFFSIFWNRIKWLTKKRPYWPMRRLILTKFLQWYVLSMVSTPKSHRIGANERRHKIALHHPKILFNPNHVNTLH